MPVDHERKARAEHKCSGVRPDEELLHPDEARLQDVADDDHRRANEHCGQSQVGYRAAHHIVDGFGKAHEACQCPHVCASPLSFLLVNFSSQAT